MISLRRSSDRGSADYGWLKTQYTFSFAQYYDPSFMGFRALRVINEDSIAPSSGFDTHGHADMEILTWIMDGALTHEDSLGNRGVLRTDEAQVMTAGTGISHREWNNAESEPVHLLQIWLEPAMQGQPASYAQKMFPKSWRMGKWQVLASPDGRNGSLEIGQDAIVSLVYLRSLDALSVSIAPGRHLWIQSISAELEVNGKRLLPGDGAAVSEESKVLLVGSTVEGDVMLFDLA